MRTITLDYETFYIKPSNGDDGYSVRTLGNWRYCHDDRFDPYLLSVYDGSESWVGHPKDFNWDSLEDSLLLAHNAGFERAVTGRLIEQGVVPTRLLQNRWQCTANMTSFLCSCRQLAESLLILEGKAMSKDVRDAMNKKRWADAVAAGMDKQLIDYALRDSVECWNLFQKYGHKWPSFERELSELTMSACSRGVAINTDLLKEYKQVLSEVIFEFEISLPWTESGAKPSSPKAIAEHCRINGIPAPPVKKDDEDAFIEWERTYRDKYPWVSGAGTWRSLNKLLKSLERIEERMRPDGTVDFSLLYFGGHTGRWSGGGGGFNMQNLRKEPIYLEGRKMVEPPAGLSKDEFKEWHKGKYDLDVRKLFVARAGKKFIISDLSQVEPRVLNWLAGNTELLEAIGNGFSYYEAYARLYKGWKGKPDTLKEEFGVERYTLLKNEALGLGYGMGPDRYVDYAGVSREEAQSTVSDFRERNTKITGEDGLWKNLEAGLFASVNGDYEIELPSGRSLTYRNVRREKRMKMNKESKQMESRTVITGGIGSKRKQLYGGFLAENITQATARDVFGTHLLALEKNTGDVIFHVHDEAIIEVDLDVTKKDVERVMSTTPDWLPGCPLSAEAKESLHYLK